MLTRISLRQLEYFIAAAETGSILVTSEKIHISASSISTAISNLEKELETQLFIRQHAKGLILTDTGKKILGLAKKIITDTNKLYDAAAENTKQIIGTLAVGCTDIFAPFLYKEIFYDFAQIFPKVDLTVSDAEQDILTAKLLSGELDLAIGHDFEINPKLIKFSPLAVLQPYVLVGELHPLAAVQTVTLEELCPYPMILLDLSKSNDYYISLFHQKKLNPNVLYHSRHTEVVRAMVANNLGYALMNIRPKLDYSAEGKRLVKLRLAGGHKVMKLGLLSLISNNNPGLACRIFRERCRHFISEQYISGMEAPYFFSNRKLSAPTR